MPTHQGKRTAEEQQQRRGLGNSRGLEVKAETPIQAECMPALRFEVADLEDPVEVGKEAVYEIKVMNPEERSCKTWLGGEPEGWLATPVFHEPAGLSIAAGKLYVADTNAHRIRVVDIATKQVTTLKLTGVEPPAAGK